MLLNTNNFLINVTILTTWMGSYLYLDDTNRSRLFDNGRRCCHNDFYFMILILAVTQNTCPIVQFKLYKVHGFFAS